MDGSELEHGQEVGGVFFVAGGDPSEVLDTIEEALDAVTGSVEDGAEGGFPATMGHRRDVGRSTGGFDLAAQPIGVISLVGEDDGAFAQMAEQLGGGWTVARLARRQQQLDRQAAGIGQGMDFGGQPATRAAHTAIRVAFFELAAC